MSLVPNGRGIPGLSSGVERELHHAFEHTKEVYVVWKPKKNPSPFITETATKIFSSVDERWPTSSPRACLPATCSELSRTAAPMPRHKITIAYDGPHSGRRNNPRTPSRCARCRPRSNGPWWRWCDSRCMCRARRTDSGVHARGQVAAFECEQAFEPDRLIEAITTVPDDVQVIEAEEVSPTFDPIQVVDRGVSVPAAAGERATSGLFDGTTRPGRTTRSTCPPCRRRRIISSGSTTSPVSPG